MKKILSYFFKRKKDYLTWPKNIVWETPPILLYKKTNLIFPFRSLPPLICLFFFCNISFATNYIHTDDAPSYVERQLPEVWRFASGASTGNFNLLPQATHIAEGWFEITLDNSAVFDPDIQTAGGFTYTLFADHAERVRIITNKPLSNVKVFIGKLLKKQGKDIIKAKWNLEDRSLGFLTAQEEIDMDADKLTLQTYFGTLRTDIINAVDVQAVKAVMTGAIWPSI